MNGERGGSENNRERKSEIMRMNGEREKKREEG
jgi:hypothetical protein